MPENTTILIILAVAVFVFFVLQNRPALDFGNETYTGKARYIVCLLYTSPSPRDKRQTRMPSSA